MKIAIDYRLASVSNRGMARYCREIVNEFFRLDSQNEFFLLVTKVPKMRIPSNFKFVQLKISNYILAEQIFIPLAVKKIKADVLWCPYNTFPIFLSKKIGLAVTIHDLIFIHKPFMQESFYKRIGRIYRKYIISKYSNRIDICFTVSNYSKSEILRYLRLSCSIDITPNCLSSEFILLAERYRTYRKSDYFFTVSGDSPSKNLTFLINIFASKLQNETLYIAGLSENSALRSCQTDKIIFLPANMQDEELVKFYSTCKAFLFPSLEEGFGIPVIEALCCVAKVVCSNASCLPEIIGKQGILFDPLDKNSFLDALGKLDNYPFFYDVSSFLTWVTTARIILDRLTGGEAT